MRRYGWIFVALAALVLWAWQKHAAAPGTPGAVDAPAIATPAGRDGDASPGSDARWPAFLPPEARDTLASIEAGGPFEHRQDGAVFQNRERRLPQQPRGYYHEYTVETPGSGDRGARRIVSGGTPPVEYFYTDDHYRNFRRFVPGGAP